MPGVPYDSSSLQWRHNERNGVLNHQRLHCLLKYWSRRRSKKTPNLCVTGLCAGNSPVTGEFPVQTASNAENVSIWWSQHYKSENLFVACSVPSHYAKDGCHIVRIGDTKSIKQTPSKFWLQQDICMKPRLWWKVFPSFKQWDVI